MCVYLRAKFEVSNLILTSFRRVFIPQSQENVGNQYRWSKSLPAIAFDSYYQISPKTIFRLFQTSKQLFDFPME